jgi:hypothetical protein
VSFVSAQPTELSAAAGNLRVIGSSLAAQNVIAAAPTTGVLPAAADEVSALTAAQFATHAEMYQAISAQAAAIHNMFVNTLGASAGSYAATEAANAVAAG